jgi:hypothetical protein
MRDHDRPWTLLLIGWVFVSVILGLSTARRLDWSHAAWGKGLLLVVLMPVAGLVFLLGISIVWFGVILAVECVARRRK